jgi:hypothetical protein
MTDEEIMDGMARSDVPDDQLDPPATRTILIRDDISPIEALWTSEGRQRVLAALTATIGTRPCFACGGERRAMLPSPGHVALVAWPSAAASTPALPCAVVQCLTCGATTLHDLDILGLLPPTLAPRERISLLVPPTSIVECRVCRIVLHDDAAKAGYCANCEPQSPSPPKAKRAAR